jgi:broad specificity phosphatase PhoE
MRLALVLGIAAASAVAVLPPPACAQADRIVILVRHAEKADEPRADPPLTDAGRARANALAAALDGAPVDAVIVTQFLRTRATAEPVTRARGLTPIVVGVESGGLAAHVQAVADAVRAQPPGATILVVGHSNTIPAIIGALGGPKLKDLCDAEYATLFVLAVPAAGSPRLVRATYGAADSPGATKCAGNSM